MGITPQGDFPRGGGELRKAERNPRGDREDAKKPPRGTMPAEAVGNPRGGYML